MSARAGWAQLCRKARWRFKFEVASISTLETGTSAGLRRAAVGFRIMIPIPTRRSSAVVENHNGKGKTLEARICGGV